jgi:5S rRNA maturation endonuclease (ribonuclease M5)
MRGTDVVVIEGAKDREQLAQLSERAWQSKKK